MSDTIRMLQLTAKVDAQAMEIIELKQRVRELAEDWGKACVQRDVLKRYVKHEKNCRSVFQEPCSCGLSQELKRCH